MIQGQAINIRRTVRMDAKRYLKLFKLHVENNNSHFRVLSTATTVTIKLDSDVPPNSFEYPYKAGVIKALYLLLCLNNYNMQTVLDSIAVTGFQPFDDDMYLTAASTPDPQPPLQNRFKCRDGHYY